MRIAAFSAKIASCPANNIAPCTARQSCSGFTRSVIGMALYTSAKQRWQLQFWQVGNDLHDLGYDVAAFPFDVRELVLIQ